MKTCEEYAALLDMYVDGFCTDEESAQVRKHLAECEACRMYVAQILQMKEAFPDAEETEVPEGFAESVMTAVRASAEPRKKRMKTWQKTLLQMAACMAIVIALGPLSERLTGGMKAEDAAMEMSMAGKASKAQAPAAPSAAMWDVKAETAADAPMALEDHLASGVAEPAEMPETQLPRLKVKLTRAQMQELLSGYVGTEQDGAVTYTLTPAEMDAVLAVIPAGNVVPGSGVDTTAGLCVLVVYPTD